MEEDSKIYENVREIEKGENLKWQVSSGMGGNFRPEWVAGLSRNQWQVWPGIRSRDVQDVPGQDRRVL